MIFTEKEYRILFDALKKYDEQYAITILDRFFWDIKNTYGSLLKEIKELPDIKQLELIIEHNDWKKIIDVDLDATNPKYANGFREAKVLQWFENQDKELFRAIIKEFNENNIDFLHLLQKNAIKYVEKNSYHESEKVRLYIANSYAYYNEIVNNSYNYKKTVETKEVFDYTLNKAVTMFQKEHHKMALGLIRKSIENKENNSKVLKWFKEFLTVNKTINPTTKKDFEWIKEVIKDWDISAYFSSNEKKMLYAKTDGITAKKIEGLYYDLDLNLIKLKNKIKTTVLGKNLRALANLLPEALGEIPEYVGITKVFNEPLVQINIMFEKNVKDEQIEAMNTLMEMILSNETVIDDKELLIKIKKTLLAVFLDETLTKKEETIKRNKI